MAGEKTEVIGKIVITEQFKVSLKKKTPSEGFHFKTTLEIIWS